MRIAFISIVKEPWGGSEELWAAAATEALRQGHEVAISAYDQGAVPPRFQALRDAGAGLFLRRGYIPPGTGLYKRVGTKALNFALNKAFNPYRDIIGTDPDIVVYSGSCYSIIDDPGLTALLHEKKIPYLFNHQVNVEYGRPINNAEAEIVRDAYRKAARVLFVSQRNLDVARRHLLDPIDNSMLVRNPVNLRDTSAIPFPASDGPAQFAMVANLLVNHKGHDILLDALRSPKWKSRDWQLNIFGSGHDEVYIRDLIRFYALEDRAYLRGRTSDIRQVWTGNHVLLMPSLCEGIPLAVVEAMLCGRPVVATDTGGHMEWLTEGETGFIAEGANTRSLDSALERAWQQRTQWAEMGRKAHETAMRLHDHDAGGTLLKTILSHGRRP
jgi:glycosyltransferase involved in cell wall biosynthesis